MLVHPFPLFSMRRASEAHAPRTFTMSESVEQPLLEEQNGASPKPPTKRRAAPKAAAASTVKARATAPAKAAAAKAPRKPAKKAGAKPEDVAQAALPLEDAAPAPRKAAAKSEVSRVQAEQPISAPEVATPATDAPVRAPAKPAARKAEKLKLEAYSPSGTTAEEWSPSTPSTKEQPARKKPTPRGRKAASEDVPANVPAPVSENTSNRRSQPASAEAPEPAPRTQSPPPAEVPPPVSSEAISYSETGSPVALPAPPGRKYPVYIPRHLARQLEQGEQTEESILAAAQAAVQNRADHPRPERIDRPERNVRHDRPDRRDQPDRHERQPRQERQDRPERGDRPDRPERVDRPDRPEIAREGRPDQPPREDEVAIVEGLVEISGKGFGFLRDPKRSFAQHPADVFVTPEFVRKYNLRDGQWIKGETRRGGRGSQLDRIDEINGDHPDKARTLPAFDELTVVNPLERIRLETVPDRYTTRVIDLMCPIGKGQRGLIVAPPRTGKTTLLQHIADAVVKNHPEITLIMLLVDERPEEVTEIKRSIPTGEIMASSNDMDVKSHTRIAQLAVERAKRLVESGRDVFILLDSITRVGRAFNNATGGGGRTMSGGMDSRALEIPRKLFAAARNTEEAGSLTIIGTALVETGSRMDDLIFQEFKGTGNMELVLDRKISDQRIYPAVDIFQSGTRREELLVPADDLHKIAIIRRGLAGHKPVEAIERLLFFAKKFPTNTQMLREIPG